MSFSRDGSAVSRAWAAIVLAASCLLVSAGAAASIVALSGTVTSHLTGEPIADVRVSIGVVTDMFGHYMEEGHAFTDVDGVYSWTGDCESLYGSCDVTVFDPPYLAGGGSFGEDAGVAVVDVALILPSTVSGVVRFPAGTAAGTDVSVDWFNPDYGTWYSYGHGTVASDGNYSIGSLPPRTYRVCTSFPQNGAVRQCFDHVNTPPFAIEPDATPVDVPEGVAVDGIDFDLVEGGTLSGTIYDGYRGIPLANYYAGVEAYDASGQLLISVEVEPSGAFHLRGLPDGTFYLGVSVQGSFSDGLQFYPGIVCTTGSCPPPTAGTPLAIAGANEISGLDFAVHPAVVVNGHVVDSTTGQGIGGVAVGAGSGTVISASGTGAYTFYQYADTSFQAGAFDAPPYIDAYYPNASCVGSHCIGNVTMLNEPNGTVLTDIDIPMQVGSVVSGHVVRSDNGMPGADVDVVLYDAGYNEISRESIEGGAYEFRWLPGTYYLEAISQLGGEATGEVGLLGCAFYLDRPCPAAGGSPADVDPTPVTVVVGETRADVDFRLRPEDWIFFSSFEPGIWFATPAAPDRRTP